MFESLKENLVHEKRILIDIRSIQAGKAGDSFSSHFYDSSIKSLLHQLRILNHAVPGLLKEESPLKKISEKEDGSGEKKKNESGVSRMSYVSPSTSEKRYVTINDADKKSFLEKLKLSEHAFAKTRKIEKKERPQISIQATPYARFSNKYFRNLSEKLSPRFGNLANNLKKSNIRVLLSTYLSMALMSVVISFFFGIFLFVVLMILNLDNWIYFWIIFLAPVLAFLVFYAYPSSQAKSINKAIYQELPFATIHMAAIAGSEIEPTKIFRILSFSNEYPTVGREFQKIIAQVEIYGYDLVTSLKNLSRRTPNEKLAELLSGLATNISSGGSLKSYLEKKSENLLLDYKLERQKYSNLAGTFMDIYISILIAAPLVLMMMFIVMNVSGLGIGGLGISTLLFISIGAIILINIIFLFVLNLKQPSI